jgi:hypothetical protein
VIAAHHLVPEVMAAYREMYVAAAPPYLPIANALEPEVAADLRGRFLAAGSERFDRADCGRYRWNGTLRVDELWHAMVTLASSIAGTALEVRAARWLLLGRGDYALVKDDFRTRPAGAGVIELSLDLSEAFSGEAEQVYADGASGVTVPQIPRMLALVARSPSTTRYDRPLTIRAGGAEVTRLRVWLTPRDAAGGAPPPGR